VHGIIEANLLFFNLKTTIFKNQTKII